MDALNWWQATILGLVEGITEYLPVSSTGHLIITSNLLGFDKGEPLSVRAVKDFEVVIQGGAILAVLGLYFPRFIQMLRGLMGKDIDGFRLLVNIIIAFIPAAAVGLVVRKTIKAHLFNAPTVIAAFIIGGIFMIVIDRLIIAPHRRSDQTVVGKELTQLSPLGALNIGLMQVFALIPGTSRSMMTISGGVLTGLRPAAAAEFSFLLGMPTLLAATGLEFYSDLKHAKETGEPTMFKVLGMGPVLIGIVVAAIAAAIAVKWLVGFLNKHGLAPFGIYRIVIGLVLAGLIAAGMVTIKPEEPAAKVAPMVSPTPAQSNPAH
ncbi:MAG: undecaprenyl-diphosphate phosphatase [Phycisphaerales bacterium]